MITIQKIFYIVFTITNITLAQIDYSSQIQPIFNEHCGNCHLGNSSGGLSLSSYDNLMEGSNNGAIVIPGDHASSIIYDRITRDNIDTGDMPPGNSQLSQTEIDLIAQWIDEGALFESAPILGDLNDDGIVNVLDIIIVTNIALGESSFNDAADINGDSIINILDIIQIINIIFS